MAADGPAFKRRPARNRPIQHGLTCPYFFFFGFLVSFFGLLSLATEILPYVEIILACGVEPREDPVGQAVSPVHGRHGRWVADSLPAWTGETACPTTSGTRS